MDYDRTHSEYQRTSYTDLRLFPGPPRENEFPAFEALVDGKVLYGDDDISSGPGLGNLGVFWDDYEAGYKTFD